MYNNLDTISGINTKSTLEFSSVDLVTSSVKDEVDKNLEIQDIVITQEEINELLGEKKAKLKITLLRHYPYDESTKENIDYIDKYNALLKAKFEGNDVNNEELKELEKKVDGLAFKKFENVPLDIQNKINTLFSNKEKTLLIFPKEGKHRVINTGNDLIEEFKIENVDDIKLPGSNKEDYIGDIYVDMCAKFKEEYDKIIEKYIDSGYENIVIIGNRTYSYGLNFLSGDRKISIGKSEKNFESIGYISNDYNIVKKTDGKIEGRIVKNNNFITVTPENYKQLISIFPGIKHDTLVCFQNKLNVYFLKNPELFKEYVFSKCDDLRKFCLVNLINQKDISFLNNIFSDEEFVKETNFIDFEYINSKDKMIINYYLNVYPKVINVRKKSFDDKIKNGEYLQPDFNFNNERYDENLLAMVNIGKSIKYIEGKAGAGKSYLLSCIAEKLNHENIFNPELRKLYLPIYVNLSGNGIDILNDLQKIDNYNDYQVVYLFDSIDESHITGNDRKKLDNKLLELSRIGKVIITCRNGYNYNYDLNNDFDKKQIDLLHENTEKIDLKDFSELNIDKYLNKYFVSDSDKIEEVKNILVLLKGAGNNPLILSMICLIVENGGFTDTELSKISIIDIYNEIVRLRLVDWNENHSDRKTKKLDNKINLLGEIAYDSFLSGKSNIDREDILKILDYDIPESVENYYLESLNLLFRKNDNGEFDFVHQSIKEYFAANHIYKLMLENNNFDYENFLCQDLKKFDINFVSLFCEIINRNIKIKKKFVEKIKENESYFSYKLHLKILFILSNLDIRLKNEYLKYIDLENIFSVIEKISGNRINILDNVYGKSKFSIELYNELFIGLTTKGEININNLNKKHNEIYIEEFKRSIYDLFCKFNIEEVVLLTIKIKLSEYNGSSFIKSIVIDAIGDFILIYGIDNYKGIYDYMIQELYEENDSKILISIINNLKKIGGKHNIEILKNYSVHLTNIINENIINNVYFNSDLLLFLYIIGGLENITFLEKILDKEEDYLYLKSMLYDDLLKYGYFENFDFLKTKLLSGKIKITEYIFYYLINKGGNDTVNLLIELYRKNLIEDFMDEGYLQDIVDTGYKEYIGFFKELMKSKNNELLIISIDSIYGLGKNDEIEYIKTFLNSKNKHLREAVKIILRYEFIINNIELQKEYLTNLHYDHYSFDKTIINLSRIGGKKNIDLIRGQLINGDKNLIKLCIKELIIIGGKENLNIIKGFYRCGDIDLVKFVIQELIFVGGKGKTGLISELFDSEEKNVLKLIIDELKHIGGEENLKLVKKYSKKLK